MKTLSFWKKSLYSAIIFFGTLVILSIGYGALTGGLSTVDKVWSGSGLTSASWNRIVDGVLDLDTRVSNFSFAGGNVGIGIPGTPAAKLDVNGHINGMPVLAKYVVTSYQAADTDVNWQSETLNTDSSYIQKNGGGTGINILVAGYYQINTHVLQYSMCDGCRWDVAIRKNWAQIGFSIWFWWPGLQQYFSHTFSSIDHFNAGDVITVNVASYPIHPSSTLEIVKLN